MIVGASGRSTCNLQLQGTDWLHAIRSVLSSAVAILLKERPEGQNKKEQRKKRGTMKKEY